MRADMFEVIIERPRMGRPAVGSAYPRGKVKNLYERDWDDSPRQLGMRRPQLDKEPNENLAPLRRFLRSRVGRPWNSVRSEIHERISVRSAVQKHVLDHLQDLVWVQTERVDGVLYGVRRGFRMPVAASRLRRLYVCPETGLLRELVWRRRAQSERPEVVPLRRRRKRSSGCSQRLVALP